MLKLFALTLALLAGAAQADDTLHRDLPLAYLEQTQGDARNEPLVIFLHGFGSERYWGDQVLALREQLSALNEEPLKLF